MKEFNEIDDAFRKALGSFEPPPSPMAWEGIKQGILEKQIVRIKQQNTFLKVASVVLALLCTAAAGMTFLGAKKNNKINNTVQRIDTVYVEKTIVKFDTLYREIVAQPKVVYITKYLQKENTKTADNEEDSVEILTSSKSNSKEILQNIASTEEKNSTVFIGNSMQNETVLKEKNLAKPLVMQPMEKVDFMPFETNKKFRKIAYEIPFQQLRAISRKEEKTAFIERLFLQPSVGVSMNKLKVNNVAIPSTYQQGKFINVDMGIQMNRGWAFRTGITYEQANFVVGGAKKQVIRAEDLQGIPSFIYRTPFGNALIANNLLSFTPTPNDFITVESENQNAMTFWQIPLVLQYDILNRDFRILGGHRATQLYVLGGGQLSIPFKKKINVEIYEADGYDFYTTLTDFKGLSNMAFGASLGFGGKMTLGRKVSLFSEASIYRNLTSLVNNEYYQSTPNGGQIKIGFSYFLK